MSADGPNNKSLEENYKKLTQKLQSVYNSARSKGDFENLDSQKAYEFLYTQFKKKEMCFDIPFIEFIKLFCKAFDWSADYDDEDEDGLQFVNNEHESEDQAISAEDQDDKVLETTEATKVNEKKAAEEKQGQPSEEKKSQSQIRNGEQILKAPSTTMTIKEGRESKEDVNEVGFVHVLRDDDNDNDNDNDNDESDTLDNEEETKDNDLHQLSATAMREREREKERESRQYNDNNKQVEVRHNESGHLNNIGHTTSGTALNQNATGNISDSSNENDDQDNVLKTDTKANNTNERAEEEPNKNILPSLSALGNASETVQLLVGDSDVARRFAAMKGTEWQREKFKSVMDHHHGHHHNHTHHRHHPQGSADELTVMGITNKANFKAVPTTANIPNRANIHDAVNMDRKELANESEPIDKTNFATPMIETHVVRHVLRQLILLLLTHHPNGVYESELQTKYQQTTNDKSKIDDNIQYLLFNHRNVLVTPCECYIHYFFEEKHMLFFFGKRGDT
ncbi:hypothetical protein RFI_08839 [Reticulomyxa filosa]|uniref:Uncharacterized protein n=1 Tax=Reticulomyxa filosa TaxID=46433 RepID=X6NQU7_RETFI|nr:hypothetical protein RFI_08839 [Reticulomyxa filosa]|eukprot:ETO28293.1 hypothetical protein RFI_08839 [Reticulomyxa filosa]